MQSLEEYIQNLTDTEAEWQGALDLDNFYNRYLNERK